MGEAILSRASGQIIAAGGGLESAKDYPNFVTNIITSTSYFNVPKAYKQEFSVRIFGGGGGGTLQAASSKYARSGSGGGGGYMNNGIFKLNQGEQILVIIGLGGNSCINSNGTTGETTSFGSYLSAAGGGGAKSYCGLLSDYLISMCTGGDGSSGGGGGTAYIELTEPGTANIAINNIKTAGGVGYQFGGGGGCFWSTKSLCGKGGNGGTWGGGGGGYHSGIGGEYGGNGGNCIINAENGINTIGIETEDLWGNAHNGGLVGGGGGYGGNGGNGSYHSAMAYGSGGGGGYGANGGASKNNEGAGGGGGYSKLGYGGTGIGSIGGGSGGYGHGADNTNSAGYGGGGSISNTQSIKNGGSGICIIQYYAP